MTKLVTNVLLISFFVLICGISVSFAQNPVILDRNPPPAIPQRTLVKSSGTAKAEYQASIDQTFANSRVVRVELPDGGWGMISSGFGSKGNAVTTPDFINLRVFTAAKTRQYVDAPKVIVKADGEILFEGTAELTGARTNGNDIYTSLEVKLTRTAFEKLADAKTLEVAQATTTWKLSGADVANFKDLTKLYQ